jgi:hypothetical protein
MLPMLKWRTSALALTLVAATAFCLPIGIAAADDDDDDNGTGAIYALTNSPAGNAVVVYARRADGSLQSAGSYAAGGVGTGALAKRSTRGSRCLDSLTPDQWTQYGVHSERGQETVEQIVRMTAGHDINHLQQIERIVRPR